MPGEILKFPTLKIGDRVLCYRQLGAPAFGLVTEIGDGRAFSGQSAEFMNSICEVRLNGTRHPILIKKEHVEIAVSQEISDAWKAIQGG
jgi:hypothetical protein